LVNEPPLWLGLCLWTARPVVWQTAAAKANLAATTTGLRHSFFDTLALQDQGWQEKDHHTQPIDQGTYHCSKTEVSQCFDRDQTAKTERHRIAH
jgi:hypothetical protein